MSCEVNKGFAKEYHTVTLEDGRSYQAFKLDGKWYRTFKTRFPNKDTAIEYARHRKLSLNNDVIVELLPNGQSDLHVQLKNVHES